LRGISVCLFVLHLFFILNLRFDVKISCLR